MDIVSTKNEGEGGTETVFDQQRKEVITELLEKPAQLSFQKPLKHVYNIYYIYL